MESSVNMIKEENGRYFVFNKEGNKKLSKGYSTKEQANKRLSEIEYFKTQDAMLDDIYKDEEYIDAEYQGKKVTLNKPFRNNEGKSKFSVYVKNDKGNIVKVNFGDPNMEIKRDDPERRKAFRERHNCTEKNDKTKAGYWSCKFWSSESVSKLLGDSMITFDRGFGEFDTKVDKDTGFLDVNGVIARTGVQDYYGMELGQEIIDKYDLDPMKKYGVYRPPDEVLNTDSLDTYINKPITDNHPNEFVTVDNIKDLGKGSVSSIETFNKDGIDYIKGRLTIKDKATINKALSGKVELSPGYSQELVFDEGEFQGRKYMFKQTDIKINHVALVDKGRCEGECKLTADNNSIIDSENNKKGKRMPQITIDNVSHEVTDCVAKYIGGLNSKIKSYDADMEQMKKDMEQKKKDMEKMEGEYAKMKEDMEEEKKKTSDATIDSLVNEKVALIDTAKTLKVEVKTSDSASDIKKSIIASNSKIDLTDKSEEFIDGVFESVLASTVGKQKDIKDSHDSAFDGFDGKKQDTNDAYEKYVKNLTDGYKGK